MTGLAERFDTLAREATSAVELLPLELAVRARRRRHIRTGIGAVVAAACAAAGSLYVATSSPGREKVVRVATPSGTTPVTTAALPASGLWAQLAGIASKAAAQYGDPSAMKAEAVATNLGRFDTAVNGGSAPFRAVFQGVYFIQMTGQFTCSICLGPHGHAPTGTVLSLAIDQGTLATTTTVLTSKPVDLNQLGQVHTLDLSSGVWLELDGIALEQATQFGDRSPQSGEAVATDLAAFKQATGTGGTSLTFNPKVYFVVVTGHFTCGPSCYNVSGKAPTGTVLSLAVDRTTFGITATALNNQPVDLSRLGQIHSLDLAAASRGTGSPTPSPAAVATVPNIAGMTEGEAGAVLERLGLLASFTTQSSSIVPRGDVIAEAPSPGSRVVTGSTISVTVSSGPSGPPSG